MDTEIVIAGGGSIGSVLGVMLDDHASIKLLRRSPPYGNVPVRLVGEETRSRDMEVISKSTTQSNPADILIITVQEQQTEKLCTELQTTTFVGSETLLVSLQNGLRAPEILAAYYPDNPVVVGTVWWSATLLNPQKILYHRKAQTVIGIPSSSVATDQDLDRVNELLQQEFTVTTSTNILQEMQKKLILNVVSPILALVKQPYPEGLEIAPVRKMVHALFDEALETAQLFDWGIDADERLANFHQILITGDIPESKNREIKHKVSTQLGMEKYGGKSSNIHELLDWLQLSGSLLADEIIQLVEQQGENYEPVNPQILTAILETTKTARCQLE